MIRTEVSRPTAWPHAGFKTTGSSQPGWRRRRGVRRLHLLLSEAGPGWGPYKPRGEVRETWASGVGFCKRPGKQRGWQEVKIQAASSR